MDNATESKPADPKEVVVNFLTRMGSGDPPLQEQAGQLFADDASFWIAGDTPISGTLHGREEIMDTRFRPARRRTVPGSLSLQIGTVLAEGDHVAAEWTSQRKVIDSKDYVNSFFGLFEVRRGKIQSLREYLDTALVKESGWFHTDPPAGSQ